MVAYGDSPWVEAGSISFNPANPPTVNWTMGCAPSTVAAANIVRNGTGDYSFFLNEAIDESEFDYKCVRLSAVAASGLWAPGCANTSDTEKRFTFLEETALGGASALADITGPVIIRFYKRIRRS